METAIIPPINPCGSCMSLACLEHHQDVQFIICSFETVAIRRCGRLFFCGTEVRVSAATHSLFFVLFFWSVHTRPADPAAQLLLIILLILVSLFHLI